MLLRHNTNASCSRLAGDQLKPGDRRAFSHFQYGPGAFKVDFALSEPVPWKAKECRRAITVHIGGTFEEIAASELAVTQGRVSDRPFVLAAQPTLFDPSRAPAGKHVLWAYCHVPNAATSNSPSIDMTSQIEVPDRALRSRLPCDCILARHISSPTVLESMDANLIGGDISGGALSLRQFLFRPSLRNYATGAPKPLPLLRLHAPRRRRPRHVRISTPRASALRRHKKRT